MSGSRGHGSRESPSTSNSTVIVPADQLYRLATQHTSSTATQNHDPSVALGQFSLPAGPISTLIPERYKEFIPEEILSSVVCTSLVDAENLRDCIPAKFGIISHSYTDHVYEHITKSLKPLGKQAMEEINPWIINILIDHANFDHIMCNEPINETTESQHASTSTSTSTSTCETTQRWSRPSVLELISQYQSNEWKFKKVGIKKKSVWKSISEKLTETDSSWQFTPVQCEQKWKNLTKTYRDTIDHNHKSGSQRKECPYYKELEECYGYKPNVKPVYTAGSQRVDMAEEDTVDKVDPVETVDPVKIPKISSSESSSPSGRYKRRKTDDILGFLTELQKEFKEEHENLVCELKEQHKDRMAAEEKKMSLMADLVKAITKN